MKIDQEKALNILQEEKTNIEKAFEKLRKIQEKVKERGKRGIDGPFPKIDKYTQGVIEGKVYTIGAFSNTGKSQLSYEYVSYFLKKGKKVLFVSTEVGSGDLLAFIGRNYYRVDYNDILFDRKTLNTEDFKNLTLFDDTHNFTEIEKIVNEYKPNVLVIDFIQSIDHIGASEYEKLTKLAIDLQKLTIQKDLITISLSQVNNESRKQDGTNLTLKGSGGLFASSDVIFGLYRDNGQVKLCISKNKFGPYNKIFDMEFNFQNGDIKISESLDCNDI